MTTFENQNSFKVPKKIGKYMILQEIGSGASGQVHIAQKVGSKDKFCVKIIPKSRIESEEDERHLIAEITIIRSLKHKNLIRFVDLIDFEDSFCIFQEFFEGQCLLDFVNNSSNIPELHIQIIFSQLIEVISFLHSKGISHRDIKLENILLNQNFELKLIDFGLASLKNKNLLTTFCGSVHYLASECLQRIPYDGKASDLWSCGVVLYALACQQLPFTDSEMDKLVKKIIRAEYTIPKNCSCLCAHLISKLLVTDPLARFTSLEVMNHRYLASFFDMEFRSKSMSRRPSKAVSSPQSSAKSFPTLRYEGNPSMRPQARTPIIRRNRK